MVGADVPRQQCRVFDDDDIGYLSIGRVGFPFAGSVREQPLRYKTQFANVAVRPEILRAHVLRPGHGEQERDKKNAHV